jgi:CBS domain-containing protein
MAPILQPELRQGNNPGMEQREVRRLPVVKEGRLVGVLSHGNLVQATGSEGAGDAATLGVTRGA